MTVFSSLLKTTTGWETRPAWAVQIEDIQKTKQGDCKNYQKIQYNNETGVYKVDTKKPTVDPNNADMGTKCGKDKMCTFSIYDEHAPTYNDYKCKDAAEVRACKEPCQNGGICNIRVSVIHARKSI